MTLLLQLRVLLLGVLLAVLMGGLGLVVASL